MTFQKMKELTEKSLFLAKNKRTEKNPSFWRGKLEVGRGRTNGGMCQAAVVSSPIISARQR